MALLFRGHDWYLDPRISRCLCFERGDLSMPTEIFIWSSFRIGRGSCNALPHFGSTLLGPTYPFIALLRKDY
jgi:hypothetical protein